MQANDGTRGQLAFAGQRAIYSNIMLDGADYNQPFFGGIRAANVRTSFLRFPRAPFRNSRLWPAATPLNTAVSTGGIMNTITKSGGNDIHGEAFYQNRNRKFSAGARFPCSIRSTSLPTSTCAARSK